jgi:beta-N-acetylhexosaminidase
MATGLRQAAGSLLVVGLSGTELTGLERAWLKLVRPGGVILFKRNIADATQTRALLGEAAGFCVPRAVRSVDVEGGTVNRLRDALAPLPSAQAVGTAARGDDASSVPRSPKALDRGHPASLAREHGELIAQAVKAFGFNTTLAPVVDLGLPESAAVMGSRCAGSTWQETVAYARPFLEGLKRQGVAGCAKHFPGLGGGTFDSHFVTPRIQRGQQLWSEDLRVYEELHRDTPMVMVNHASYPDQKGGDRPASASSFWIKTVLRKRIGYRGLIVSDDLEMGGILKFMPVDEAAVAAMRAGTDLMLICHSAELILRSYEALVGEAERSGAFRALLLTRAKDVARKQAKNYGGGEPKALTAKQLLALKERIMRFEQRVAAYAKVDAIDPRATAPAETS